MAEKFCCYTTGYVGKDPIEFCEQVIARNALLLDIRLYATSSLAGWNKADLAAQLGRGYHHLSYLGNKAKFAGEAGGEQPVDIVDLEKGLDFVGRKLEMRSVILMCSCREFERCHRKVVAQALWKRSIQTEELPDHDTETLAEDVRAFNALMGEGSPAALAAEDAQEDGDDFEASAETSKPKPTSPGSPFSTISAPSPEVMARWNFSHPTDDKWTLTDPTDARRVLYLYAIPTVTHEGKFKLLYRAGQTAFVGNLLPPPALHDNMSAWERKNLIEEWEQSEDRLLKSIFRDADRLKKAAASKKRRAA